MQDELPDDVEASLRNACNDVVAAMGRTQSFGFKPDDPDFETMTERICEKLFAGEPAPSRVGVNRARAVTENFTKDRNVCPVVKAAMLGQGMHVMPCPNHEHCSDSGLRARDRAPLAPLGTAGYDSKTRDEMLRRFHDGDDPNVISRGAEGLAKPVMSAATLRKAGYDEKTCSGVDSLTNLLSKQPPIPQFPPTWIMAQHNERVKLPGGAGSVKAKKETNFDDEARKLWARLNIDPTKENTGRYNSCDAIFCHPDTGATIYVGNEVAAKNLSVLEEHTITHIVNCTDSIPNHHEGASVKGGKLSYLRFDIVGHREFQAQHQTVEFVEPVLKFISDALSRGENVMVHCLAGAHRAGTTGIICLMHFAKLSAREAILMAKRCRPIIEPIGDFPELLARLEGGWAQPSLATSQLERQKQLVEFERAQLVNDLVVSVGQKP